MNITLVYRALSRFQESKLVLSDIIRTANSVAITLLAMSFLDSNSIGLYFFGSAVVIIYSLLTRLGGESLVVRSVSENNAIGFSRYSFLSLIVYFLILFPICKYIFPVFKDYQLSLIFLSIPLIQSLRYFEFYFRAKSEFGILIRSRLVSSLLLYTSVIFIFYIDRGLDVYALATILLFEQAFFLLVTFFYYIFYDGYKQPSCDFNNVLKFTKDAKIVVFGSLASVLALKLPVLFLGRFGSEIELSIVSTQLRVLDLLLLVPTLLFNSYLPKLLNSYQNNSKYTEIIVYLTRVCVFILFVMSLFGFVISLLFNVQTLSLISGVGWIMIFFSGLFSILGSMTAKHLVVVEDYKYIALRNFMFLLVIFLSCLLAYYSSVSFDFLSIILASMFFVNVAFDYLFVNKRDLAMLKRKVIL